MNKNNTKMIKVLTGGVLPVKPFLYGPVLTPYPETYDRIFTMVTANVQVVEVLQNGEEVKLSTSNFDSDNEKTPKKNTKVEKETKEPVAPKIQDAPVEVEPEVEPVIEEPKKEIVEDVIHSTDKIQKPKNNKKK